MRPSGLPSVGVDGQFNGRPAIYRGDRLHNEVVPKQAAAAQEEHSSDDSEDSKYNAHQVEIAMDFGDIQI